MISQSSVSGVVSAFMIEMGRDINYHNPLVAGDPNALSRMLRAEERILRWKYTRIGSTEERDDERQSN